MVLTPLDWLVIAAYFAVNLAIGFFYMRAPPADIGEFFLSGRNVSWWLAGTSMVATTFAADTPLVVTGLIYAQGIAGNWLWWSFLLSGMLTVFFFPPALAPRPASSPTWSSLSSATPARPPPSSAASAPSTSPSRSTPSSWAGSTSPWPRSSPLTLGLTPPASSSLAVFCLLALTLAYNAISGLWAVLWDQPLSSSSSRCPWSSCSRTLPSTPSVACTRSPPRSAPSTLAHLHPLPPRATPSPSSPSTASPFFPVLSFLVLLSLNWWARWYPGAEPGGGGYIAQRIFCEKDESTPSALPSGSTSPTTPCAPGPGSSPPWSPSSCCPTPPPRRAAWRAPTSG